MSRFWSKTVHSLTPYVPGEQPQINNLIKLNTNENPYGPSPKVLNAIKQQANDELRKYPDPNGQALKNTIARYYDLTPDQIFVGNSSDEVLAHTFQALLKQDLPLCFPDLTYSFYPVYCGLYDISYKTIPLTSEYTIDLNDYPSDNGGIIFANPNAPTGHALSTDIIRAALETHSNSVVVVDEAYVDFGGDSAVSLIKEYDNLLVTQTLSKSRSLAGLRVGFACGNTALINGLERVKNSFNSYPLDKLALAGAVAAFEDDTYFQETCAKVISTRDNTIRELTKLGFNVLPSAANFVLAEHATKSAKALFEALREQAIIVRYFNTPRIDNYLRISIGTDEEMHSLFKALRAIT